MCISDWRIGRLIRAVVSTKTITSTGGVILPSNADRVAITFCNDVTANAWVVPELTAAADVGFLIAEPVATGTVNTTGTLTMPGQVDVVALNSSNTVITANYTGTITEPGEVVTAAFTGPSGSGVQPSFYHFTLKDYGDLPTRRWNAISDTETDTITVVEYFLPENQLTQLLEELRVKGQTY